MIEINYEKLHSHLITYEFFDLSLNHWHYLKPPGFINTLTIYGCFTSKIGKTWFVHICDIFHEYEMCKFQPQIDLFTFGTMISRAHKIILLVWPSRWSPQYSSNPDRKYNEKQNRV